MVVIAGLVVLGGTIAITQLASAEDNETQACAETTNATTLRGGDHREHRRRPRNNQPPAPEEPAAPPEDSAPPEEPAPEEPAPEEPAPGDPAPEEPAPEEPAPGDPAPEEPATPPEDCDEDEGGEAPPAPPNNGLDVLGQDCEGSNLEAHTGFQEAPRCVSTEFGEISAAAQNPSLLIADAPRTVGVNQAFQLQVSTRNLVRDRFLGAAAGGYYLESSFLNGDGLQRGHFHAACRMLESTDSAPNPEPVPAFFRAVEDGGGGAAPDTVTVEVTGMPTAGTAQCAVWAGDGSHRLPMMARANQTPAFDAVRIRVR